VDRRQHVTFPAPGSPNKRRRFERPVVDEASGERRMLPVDGESNPQGSRDFVNAASRKQHNLCIICHGRGKMPVFGQQDPILFGASKPHWRGQ